MTDSGLVSGRVPWRDSGWRAGRGLRAGVASLALLALLGGQAFAVSLEEAVRRAVETNPDIAAAAGDRRAADEQVRQARAGYLPQADIRSSIGREWANTPGTRAAAPSWEDDARRRNRTDASLSIRQMLFDGFETESDVERRRFLTESAASRVLQSAEQVGLDAIEAFIETLRATDIVAINRENVRTHEAYVAALKKRIDRGAGDVGDLRRAESRLASARGQLIDAEGRLKDAAARYRRTIGDNPDSLDRPAPPERALPPDVEAAVDLALRSNPLVQRAEAEVEAARAQQRQAKSGYYPRFDVELNGQTGDNLHGEKGRDSTANALLVMRYNLSRGGADMARAQEAVERLAAANERLAGARLDVERDTRLSWSALRTARARAIAADEQVQSDARGRDAFRRQFDLGRSRILDLLDSERDYYNSLQTRTSLEATALFGAFRVLQSAGVLLRTLDVKPPAEATGGADLPWSAEVAVARPTPPPPPAGDTTLPPGQPMRPPPELGRPVPAQPLAPDARDADPLRLRAPQPAPSPRTQPGATEAAKRPPALPPAPPSVPPVARLTPVDTTHLPPANLPAADLPALTPAAGGPAKAAPAAAAPPGVAPSGVAPKTLPPMVAPGDLAAPASASAATIAIPITVLPTTTLPMTAVPVAAPPMSAPPMPAPTPSPAASWPTALPPPPIGDAETPS